MTEFSKVVNGSRPAALSAIILAILVATNSVPRSSVAEDWYRWRGPNQDGISTETNWRCDWPGGEPKIAWTCAVGTGFSSIVIKDGRAITIGFVDGQANVSCINVDDGQAIWNFGYAANLDDRDFEGGPTSTATIDGDRVYVLARAGDLFCLQLSDGALLWQTNVADSADVRLPGWGCSGAPLVVGEKLLVNIGESGVVLDKPTGGLLWSSADRECGYATPIVIPDSNPPTAILASGRAFIGVNVESGEQLWSERWLTSFNCNAADPILHDGKMFLSSGYNRGSALFDLAGGTPSLIWKSKEMKNQIHTSLLYEEHLYGIDGDMESGARLRCMEWSTGKVIWSVDDLRPGGLALADGKLLVLTESGELIIAPASPSSWMPTSRVKIIDGKCWTAPVLCDGRLFCRSIQGQLVCVDCRE